MKENELQKLIDKKREAFKRFDALPEKRQKELTAAGLNPHEPKETRELKKAAALEKRKKEFDKLPKEQRDILTAIGWNPHQQGQIINRSTSYYEKHGSYISNIDND